jgi:hypothetical protein
LTSILMIIIYLREAGVWSKLEVQRSPVKGATLSKTNVMGRIGDIRRHFHQGRAIEGVASYGL